MAISKLNAEQFSAMSKNFSGVVLEYAGKDGKNTAIHFFGVDYEATAKTQNETLRVVKNVMLAHWVTKTKETKLRESNDGIRTKLRASTPLCIHIHTDKGETVKSYRLEDSVWAKIGLMPTKVDLERSQREQKKTVHGAAIAMLEALNFRVELPKEDEISTENTNQTPAVETAPQTTVAETLTVETEPQVPIAETPAVETESQVPIAETPTVETEPQVPVAETPAVETPLSRRNKKAAKTPTEIKQAA